MSQASGGSRLGNLKKPVQLDVISENDWTSISEKLREESTSTFTGVIICEQTPHCDLQTLTKGQVIYSTVHLHERRTTYFPIWAVQERALRL
jgi:hypothetical protein